MIERVVIYDENGKVVGRIKYSNNLDYPNGCYWLHKTNGFQKGLMKLYDGRYVLIYIFKKPFKRSYGKVVSPDRALQEILGSNSFELLNTRKFVELKQLADQILLKEFNIQYNNWDKDDDCGAIEHRLENDGEDEDIFEKDWEIDEEDIHLLSVIDNGRIIALVEYNDNLDFFEYSFTYGNKWSCGQYGRHKGLTRLEDGRYVLIQFSDMLDERDHADIISPEQALQEILKSGNFDLLEQPIFEDLKTLYDSTIIKEEEWNIPYKGVLINVYDNDKVIGQVWYQTNLDNYIDGHWSCGQYRRHKGLTRLEDGRYVLIYGNDFVGERNYAIIISPEEAAKEIIDSEHFELFEDRFSELKELAKEIYGNWMIF